MRVLGIDPGLQVIGWALLECEDSGIIVRHAGEIQPSKVKCPKDRTTTDHLAVIMHRIGSAMFSLEVDLYPDSLVGIEMSPPFQGGKASAGAWKVSMVHGLLFGYFSSRGYTTRFINPRTARAFLEIEPQKKRWSELTDREKKEPVIIAGEKKWGEGPFQKIPRGRRHHAIDAAAVAEATYAREQATTRA